MSAFARDLYSYCFTCLMPTRSVHTWRVALQIFGNVHGGFLGRDSARFIHHLWDRNHAGEIVRVFRHTLAS